MAMRYFLKTYGCQMNAHDSEYLAGVLKAFGWEPAPLPDAELVLLNTCSVRDNAEQKVRSLLGKLRERKTQQPGLTIGVLGCMAERAHQDLARQPEVDFLLAPRQLERFPEILRQLHHSHHLPLPVDMPPVFPWQRQQGVTASVNITLGCDNFCSYCVVPYVRGREASRDPGEVQDEVEQAVACGFQEVLLLGQNVNAYGREWPGWSFARLLEEIHPTPGLQRIRYMTSHPRDYNLALLDVIQGLPKVCDHFHLPVQSGSDRILQAMNRGYSRRQYLSLVQAVRQRFPQATITTDLIVGYPDEGEAEFLDTLALMNAVVFDNAHILAYSPRPGTTAWKLGDPVPREEKERRLALLMEVHAKHALERNLALRGSTLEVLVEGRDRKSGMMRGRSRGNKEVFFPGEEGWVGGLRWVRIETAAAWSLLGTAVPLPV
jgi:tRNA-2-methylthio-N6-dimethylallyladenosine synthase